ncbi:hypothetical protein GCK32_013994 [Trichostrongylus colubriformis]|uniref:Uncharacterized protein n=1 Tax=Trichostrongylus colubriformis TaxID=6319 RepID=A0AAN8FL32_TRICO
MLSPSSQQRCEWPKSDLGSHRVVSLPLPDVKSRTLKGLPSSDTILQVCDVKVDESCRSTEDRAARTTDPHGRL